MVLLIAINEMTKRMIKEDKFDTMALLLCLDHDRLEYQYISIDTIDNHSLESAQIRKNNCIASH